MPHMHVSELHQDTHNTFQAPFFYLQSFTNKMLTETNYFYKLGNVWIGKEICDKWLPSDYAAEEFHVPTK